MSPHLEHDANVSHHIDQEDVLNVIRDRVAALEDECDAFFVANLSDVISKHDVWKAELPRVQPHYAVQCNDDLGVLSTLAQLGVGFECVTKADLQKVLSLKISPDRIIYANPCKQSSHIRYAAKHKVSQMAFDNEMELHKIKSICPTTKLILHIQLPQGSVPVSGMQMGCTLDQVPSLLRLAKQLELDIIGVRFNVEHDYEDVSVYSRAVHLARNVFDLASKEGFNMRLLDVGDGFPGTPSEKIPFQAVSAELRASLDKFFPASSGVRVVAGPGKFYVASAFTLATNIIAKRAVPRDVEAEVALTGNDQPTYSYYINDGVYGSFKSLLFDDKAGLQPTPLQPCSRDTLQFPSSVWGPSCDSLDCILSDVLLPELSSGNWIIFQDMGANAITNSLAGTARRCHYIADDTFWWHVSLPKGITVGCGYGANPLLGKPRAAAMFAPEK